MATKYRMTAEDAGVPGMAPGEWEGFESDEDETLLHPAHTPYIGGGSRLLHLLTDPQLRIERQHGSLWEPASWRHLSPIEQSRRGDRARQYQALLRDRRNGLQSVDRCRVAVDNAREGVRRAEEEAKAAPLRLKNAEGDLSDAEKALSATEKALAHLRATVTA